MRIGQVIKKWRLLSDLDYKKAAQKIGIGGSTLLRIEAGKVPDGETLIKVLNWLMGEESDGTDSSTEGAASEPVAVGSESGDENSHGGRS